MTIIHYYLLSEYRGLPDVKQIGIKAQRAAAMGASRPTQIGSSEMY